jgi:hypothetical protein
MEITVAEIAEQILTVMPEERWIKGKFGEINDMGWDVCVLGAYDLVMYGWPLMSLSGGKTTEEHPFLQKLIEVIQEQFPERAWEANTIWHFNDDARTTYDDVRLVLEKIRAGS